MTDLYTRQSTFTNGTTADAAEVEAEFSAVHSAVQQISAIIAALGLGTLVPNPTLAKAGLPVTVTSNGAAFEIPTATAFLTALGLSANGKTLITAADYAAMKVLLAIAATNLVATQSNVLIGRATSGAGAFEEIALSAAGRALIDDDDGDAQLTTLGGTTAGKAIFKGATYAAIRALLGIDGPVLLQPETSITAVASLDFANIFAANSTYPYFQVVIEGADISNNVMWLRFSDDGSTFESGASYYEWIYADKDTDTSAVGSLADASDSKIVLDVGTTGSLRDGVINFVGVHGASKTTAASFKMMSRDSGQTDETEGIGCQQSASVVTGFQLIPSSGNFGAAGKVRIYGSFRPFS